MGETQRGNGKDIKGKRLWRLVGFILVLAVAVLEVPSSAIATDVHIEPLGSAWENVIVPKHRPIISFMDSDYGLKTFRGQSADVESDLSGYYGTNAMVTTASDLGVSGKSSSRVFSQTQAAGVVPQTVTISDDFMGTSCFDKVPINMLCTSYLTKLDDDGDSTALWMELTGKSETTGEIERIGRVKLEGIKRPYYKYKFNADLLHVYAPALDENVAHDMVAWDWNEDGYTDWLVSYLTNPEGKDSHKNMKIAFLFIDGKSLYDACRGSGNVKAWTGPWIEFTTGGDVIFGLTTVQPPNSIRTAIGDMDGDGNPEVALYYTKVQGTSGGTHNNHLKILRLSYNGTDDPVWDWFYEKGEGVGRWRVQNDSVTVAMGDLDGDGFDELAVLHGNSKTTTSVSTLYLDVYKIINGEVEKLVSGEEVGTTAIQIRDSIPAVEAAIADLDGDGFDELVHVHTTGSSSFRLYVDIHKWPVVDGVVALSGAGTRYGYYLTDLDDDWCMDLDYSRFSMDTGMYIYPETEKLRKQIGLVSTLGGSSEKNGIRWGVFNWDASSGLTLLGEGTKSDGQLACNVVPTITAVDLDGDSMVLGEPTGFTVYDNIEPIFIIQAPPRHWDVVSVDGSSRTMDAFAVLDGYSTTMSGKTSDSEAESTTKTSSGQWGASAGATVSRVKFFKDSVKMFDAGLEYAGDAASKDTTGQTVTTTASLKAVAQYDDQIYFRANTHDVWRYPVLLPASLAVVESGDMTYRKYVQFIVPNEIKSSFTSTAGKEVDWYEPRHNGLNLFSYPQTLEQTRDFPQGAASKPDDDFWKDLNGLVLAKSTGQVIGNVDSTESNFTMEVDGHEDDLSSLTNSVSGYANLNWPSLGVLIAGTGNFSLNGDYSYATDSITTSDKSKLGGITVSWPGVAKYVSPSGMTPSDQQFTVDAAIYTSDSGVVSFAYAVPDLARRYSQIWGSGSPYTQTADPALNLPRQWVINGGNWQENPFSGDADRIRGILFEEASLVDSKGVSGKVMPINTQVHANMRVYNYSFVPTGKVTATLSFQPIATSNEEPDITKAIEVGFTTIASIPGREQGNGDNWQDLSIVFTTHDEQALGYLHVVLSTDGGNLQTNNDHGQILVGVYDPAQYSFSNTIANMTSSSSDEATLNIVAGSMSIRPLNPDGTLGEDTTYLDPGQTAVVSGVIRFDDVDSTKRSALLNVSVFLRNDKGILSHRMIPLLRRGSEHVVNMVYLAPESAQVESLQMIVTSPTLPAVNDGNPEGRIASAVLDVGDTESGCSLGLVAPEAGLMITLPLLILLKKH